MQELTIRGFRILKGFLETSEQVDLVRDLRNVAKAAPMRAPITRWGKPMSVRMTSAGRVGWISDRKGYRYEGEKPDGGAWPKIPKNILNLWRNVTELERAPDCCLINYYGEDARMGLHQDKDEGEFQWPVVSVSLGDDGLFRMGNVEKGGKTESIWLNSGDVVVMGGDARLAYHGVDRIRFGSSKLLPDSGRVNLTLRVVAESVA